MPPQKHGQVSQGIALLMFLLIPMIASAQFDSLGINTKWCDGSILLDDGSEMKGYIKHNDKMGLVKFKQNLQGDNEEHSFTDSRILAMEYFDRDLSRYRKFAAFDLKYEQSGWQGHLLYEIMLECKTFAVLSRQGRVNQAIRARSNYPYGTTTYVKVGYEQFEQICLIGPDGKAEVLLVTNKFEKDKFRSAEPVKPYLNKKLLTAYMGSKWDLVKAYIKANRLKLKSKVDLMMTLEYYSQLEKEEI